MLRLHAWSRHWGVFLQTFCPYKSAILDLSILFKANYPVIFFHKLSSNKKLSSSRDRFVTISKQAGTGLSLFQNKKRFSAFPTKSVRASSVALINPPFCGDTFSSDTK